MQIPVNSIRFFRTAALDGGVPCEPIRLVQYDKTMPVAAIALTENGIKYTPPAGALLKVRMKKADGKGVYNDALGLSDSGEVLFLFTQQMTAAFGQGFLNVEVTLPDTGAVKCSDAILVFVAENAVQEGQIESADEFLTLVEILEQCKKLAAAAQESAEDAQDSAEDAALSMQNAANSAAAAAKSAAEALSSKNAAAVSASQAADSAQGIQEAKDDAAQSAASAEESAIRAENAARESLGFRTFNGSVRPDENGDLDPSRPMFAGTGESITVKATGDRINSIISHGFTEQAGSGDPSPDNVRPINVCGKKLVEVLIDGSFTWRKHATFEGLFFFAGTIFGITPKNSTGVYGEQYVPPTTGVNQYTSDMSAQIDQYGAFAIVNKKFKSDSEADVKAYFTKNPMKFWYEPENEAQATGIYVPIVTSGEEYRCECLKVNEFLCEGDTVDTCGTENHLWGFLKLTENDNWVVRTAATADGEKPYFALYIKDVPYGAQTVCDAYKNWGYQVALKNNAISTSIYLNNGFTVRDDRFSDVESWKQHLKSNPITVLYKRSTIKSYSNEPVEITSVPTDDGTFKVSSDSDVSVYLKPFSDASTVNGKELASVAASGSYNDLTDKPTALKNPNALTLQMGGSNEQVYDGSEAKTFNVTPADIGALGATEKAESAKTADAAASGYGFYFKTVNTDAGVEAQAKGVRLSWGKEYSYKLFFGQDPTYGDALCLHPSSSGTYALGNSTARWASIYSTNGTIQTSDATRKEQITALGEKQLAFFEKLRPVSYKLKSGFDDAANHDRLHYGFIAQEVEQAMGECGITAMEFGGLCKDKEIVLAKTLNEDGTESLASKETGADIYSLRYQEFIALNTAAIQALKQEVTALRAELNTMKKGDAET